MRHEANQQRVERFMAALGAAVRGPGRVYFTGGVSAVLMGWREMTIDLDLKAEPEPAGFFEALPALKEALDINLELACPSDFIPALSGWQERSRFIAQHGGITFHHYDFYSQALAKLERWHTRDRLDVGCMIESGLVDKARLLEFFRSIEPALIRYPAIDPKRFSERVLQCIMGVIDS